MRRRGRVSGAGGEEEENSCAPIEPAREHAGFGEPIWTP